MNLVFVEYRVFDTSKKAFLKFIRNCPGHERMELFESPEQPGLYVEIWKNMSEEDYRELKESRQKGSGEWEKMNGFLQGGLERVHIWLFTPVLEG
ncbi:hypothetical protein [Paenibacillus senegalensis]|uniref:hypothetical protein n=1 Tax=Paenibacillus senegalensis TaxID=1465766 RepID=UPI000288235D|nr:hypothetical protein [Paenibacillus senegalensis]